MDPRIFLLIAAVSGALAVTAGAFAAHGLEPLRGARAVSLWETASQYQLIHAVALLFIARLEPGRLSLAAGALFTAGSLLFCGALYGLGWWGPSALGAVAPIGGLSFILGWVALAGLGLQRR
jgi:uncharacterized membrane protein YgdD (TMEM256/DUF423 family)